MKAGVSTITLPLKTSFRFPDSEGVLWGPVSAHDDFYVDSKVHYHGNSAMHSVWFGNSALAMRAAQHFDESSRHAGCEQQLNFLALCKIDKSPQVRNNHTTNDKCFHESLNAEVDESLLQSITMWKHMWAYAVAKPSKILEKNVSAQSEKSCHNFFRMN